MAIDWDDILSCDECENQFDCSEIYERDGGNICESCINDGGEE